MSNRSLPRPYITVQDAVTLYERSRSTIYRLLKAHRLHYHRQPGDTRTYLSVHELDAVMRIQQAERAAGNTSSRRNPARDEDGIRRSRAD
ncbi:MAG: helix-turn-helix domain-containing protein [Candidatus Dormibacteraeota bacterium]|nr:helix-turn-helix domain-containing protein [Candidatus Dormibacteraeota bacterium]